MELQDMFDRVVVINLDRRKDRLEHFYKEIEKCNWPFKHPERVRAIDGDIVPPPHDAKQGGRANGCRLSHMRVIQDALHDGLESLLIMEDDCSFRSNFREELDRFLEILPDDWDGIYFGGQAQGDGVKEIKPGLGRAYGVGRTHCYGVRRKYMQAAHKFYDSTRTHIDWFVEQKATFAKHNLYAPLPRFIAQQYGGKSDIAGRETRQSDWTPPPKEAPLILFKGPKQVLDQMIKDVHWHPGYERDSKSGIDKGVKEAFGSGDLKQIKKWGECVAWEAASLDPPGICCMYHPLATPEHLKGLWGGEIVVIEAKTIQEAKKKHEELLAATA